MREPWLWSCICYLLTFQINNTLNWVVNFHDKCKLLYHSLSTRTTHTHTRERACANNGNFYLHYTATKKKYHNNMIMLVLIYEILFFYTITILCGVVWWGGCQQSQNVFWVKVSADVPSSRMDDHPDFSVEGQSYSDEVLNKYKYTYYFS